MTAPTSRTPKHVDGFLRALLCAPALGCLWVGLWPDSVSALSSAGRVRVHWAFWPFCTLLVLSTMWLLAWPGKTPRQLRAFTWVALTLAVIAAFLSWLEPAWVSPLMLLAGYANWARQDMLAASAASAAPTQPPRP